MALPRATSIGTGLAVAGLVVALFMSNTPNLADIRVSNPADDDIDAAERATAWQAAAVVAGISLLAQDPTIFVIGGTTVIGMAWITRHANQVDPETGRAANGQPGMFNRYAPGGDETETASGDGGLYAVG